MLTTKRKPAGVPRKHINGRRNDRRAVTAAAALVLARVFGNSADFLLNVQRRFDVCAEMNTPQDRARVENARPLRRAARQHLMS